MTFADSVRFLFTLGHELKTMKWDLGRIETLLSSLGSPQKKSRFIHVAGTNGKGSTCAMLSAALQHAGYRTGLYTSPHLVSPTERIQIDGQPISEDEWTAAFVRVHGAVEGLLAEGVIDAHPSFFETLTAMAFLVFAEAKLDIVVLEVGLGGRLDATNVVTPEIAVITPVDFDHEAFLGSSIALIAAEKAGIMKAGRPAVFSSQRDDALAVLDDRALDLNIPVSYAALRSIAELHIDRYQSRFVLLGEEEIPILCPLAGEHQVDNARTAAVALERFGLSAAAISAGIAKARWPGRLQRISESPDIILDGAHNPAGARALARYIERFFAGEPVRIVFGAMRDKAVEEVTNALFSLAAEVVLTMPKQPRALHPEAIVETLDHPRVVVCSELSAAISHTQRFPMTTFITGSLYLVGEALELLA